MRVHGTHTCYVWGPDDGPGHGCHCDPCKAAAAAYERARKRRTAPPYVDAAPTRAHVEWLTDQGVGHKQVAKTAGVAHGTISKLIYGDTRRGTAPSRRIRKSTEERILAVTPAHGADGSRIPAGPTLAHVRRLVAAGVPKVRIAERIGQKGPGLQLGSRYVTRGHARAIAAMAAELDAGTLTVDRFSRWGHRPVELPKPPSSRYSGGLSDTDYQRRRRGGLTDAELAKADTSSLFDRLAEAVQSRMAGDWRRRAACRNQPTWLFFPSTGDTETARRALAICATCPVREQCLDAHHQEDDGIFGGTTPDQRTAIPAEAAS